MSEAATNPFPEIIPIFPLTGVLLLPRGKLPLNIFEPRYLAMTRDALGGERLIGMVQPNEPQDDNRGRGGTTNPPVYPVGCAGRITAFSETDDGRHMITLTGVSRFRITDELPLLNGYRRVKAQWTPFTHDLSPVSDADFDRERLTRGLRGFFTQRQIQADWDAIDKAPGEHLVTSISMLCPFAPSEKQALLEAADLNARAQLLSALVEMATIKATPEEGNITRH
jgi:Lon protease-like protein